MVESACITVMKNLLFAVLVATGQCIDLWGQRSLLLLLLLLFAAN